MSVLMLVAGLEAPTSRRGCLTARTLTVLSAAANPEHAVELAWSAPGGQGYGTETWLEPPRSSSFLDPRKTLREMMRLVSRHPHQ